MVSCSCGSPGIRFNIPYHTLRSLLLPWGDGTILRRILPLSLLLLYSSSTLPLAYAQPGRPQIDPPDPPPQECASFAFTWSGGIPPYSFRIKATNDTTIREPFPSEEPSENTTYIWNPVDIGAGTTLYAELKDSFRIKATTGPFVIQAGDDGCPGTVNSTSSTLSSTSSTQSSASSSDSASTTSTSSTSIPSPPSSSASTPSDLSSSASQTSSQRLSTGAIVGIAIGMVVLVLLAAAAFLYWRRRRTNRGAAGALFGGAKYRAARNSVNPLSKSVEQPVTFWNANLFVREKEATTQVRYSLLSPLNPRPDLTLPTLTSRDTPSLHSKGDDELVSLVDQGSDSDSDASEVMSTRPSPIHLSTPVQTPYSPPSSSSHASASPEAMFDGTELASTTGGGAGGHSHGSRP